jgi:hypothetical protein
VASPFFLFDLFADEVARAFSEYILWEVKGVYALFVSFEEGFDYLDFNRFFQDAFPQLLIP